MLELANFQENGIALIKNFLSEDELSSLKKETEFLFSKNMMMGHGFAIRLCPFRCEIAQPIASLFSINLFEKAIVLAKIINALDHYSNDDMVLAHVALYSEKNNKIPLEWHSDHRNGKLVRVQLCIKGSEDRSGAFQYVVGSHKEQINSDYTPTKEYLKENAHRICTAPPASGYATLINTEGYHSKTICIEERVSIMFDFLPRAYIRENPSDVVSCIHLRNDQITENVLQNIHHLNIGPRKIGAYPNTPDYYKFTMKFGGALNKFPTLRKLTRVPQVAYSWLKKLAPPKALSIKEPSQK